MKADIKAKWVKELREGGHKQCRKTLFDSDGFCCLGVLEHFVMGSPLCIDDEGIAVLNDSIGLLHDNRIAELRIPMPHQSELARQNDSGKTFGEIADYIEANL